MFAGGGQNYSYATEVHSSANAHAVSKGHGKFSENRSSKFGNIWAPPPHRPAPAKH